MRNDIFLLFEILRKQGYELTDGWGLIADKNPLIAFTRRKVTFAKDGDFNTGDYLKKVTFRQSVEVNNPLGLYWSAGQ